MIRKRRTSRLVAKLESIGVLPRRGWALDLGSGEGHESLALASRGFRVVAVDQDIRRIRSLRRCIIHDQNVRPVHSDISQFKIQPKRYSLIVARNSLPFLKRKRDVLRLIGAMARGLQSGGVLFFTLFGPHDAWADRRKRNMSFFTYDEIIRFLRKLKLTSYVRSTEEGYGPTMTGQIKFWHIHTFIYRKKASMR